MADITRTTFSRALTIALVLATSTRAAADPTPATAGANVAAAVQILAMQQAILFAYIARGAAASADAGVDDTAWLTRGAELTTVPSTGPVADYFTNGAEVFRAIPAPSVEIAAVPAAADVQAVAPTTIDDASASDAPSDDLDVATDAGAAASTEPMTNDSGAMSTGSSDDVASASAPSTTRPADNAAAATSGLLGAPGAIVRPEVGRASDLRWRLAIAGTAGAGIVALVIAWRRRVRRAGRDEGG